MVRDIMIVGATLLGHRTVGARAYVSAGAVVREDLADGETLST